MTDLTLSTSTPFVAISIFSEFKTKRWGYGDTRDEAVLDSLDMPAEQFGEVETTQVFRLTTRTKIRRKQTLYIYEKTE